MERLIAKDLLDIKAVFLNPKNPFTWASGIISPIYCDNRLTLSNVKVRNDVENALASLIKEKFPECEMVMGTATAGIAHGAIVAHLLNLPCGYVRASAKDHGRQNAIEGRCEKGTKVVVVEDLISTAKSSVEVVNVLRENGIEVLGIVSIFTYGMSKALKTLEENNLVNYSVSNIDVLVEIAAECGYIEESEKEKILKFRDNPSDTSWRD